MAPARERVAKRPYAPMHTKPSPETSASTGVPYKSRNSASTYPAPELPRPPLKSISHNTVRLRPSPTAAQSRSLSYCTSPVVASSTRQGQTTAGHYPSARRSDLCTFNNPSEPDFDDLCPIPQKYPFQWGFLEMPKKGILSVSPRPMCSVWTDDPIDYALWLIHA